MELQGKITNTSFRNGKRADGSTWEAVDYWIIEQGVRYGSEFQFTLFGDNMKAYALRKGAEGLFAFKLASVMRNGFYLCRGCFFCYQRGRHTVTRQ